MTGAQPTQRHCGDVRVRQSANTHWPLRAADGRTWAERKAQAGNATIPHSSPRT